MSDINRLRWKCRRGMLELDLVLQQFLERDYVALDDAGKKAFEDLLESGDEALWAFIGDELASPVPEWDSVINQLRAC